ncbi:TetR/AcrR family transcriptional regulator [Catenulispora pinistramenti]|uniref:TetR/AcrR family transcriptional regulator n=1 Tax=Catenulispora pinistramenti TaxID=2705254 RepID=UPI001E4A0C91|nr:TetR/AcrR family transcriptional regulator [Catenulispora pinistramenti]
MTTEPTPKPLPPAARRTDAERNRAKILTAAREAFADPDAEVSMAEVARRAGVGMATLYRNYPGRPELLQALYADEVDAICQAAEAADGQSPGEALQAWLRQLFTFFAGKRHLAAELLKHTDRGDPLFDGGRAGVVAAGAPLLAAAQAAGTIRGDLDIEQVLDLVHAVATIRGDPARVQPLLQAALDGLRGLKAG